MTKQATQIKAGDEIYYAPHVITVKRVVSDTVIAGFHYDSPNTDEELYGWYNADDTVEMA